MKQKHPASYRRRFFRAVLFCLILAALFLSLSGYCLTPRQALRRYERDHLFSSPTETVMRGNAIAGERKNLHWLLNENENCLLLFTYGFFPSMGWALYSCNTIDTSDTAPVYMNQNSGYLFGKICDPEVLSVDIDTEFLLEDYCSTEKATQNLFTRDMTYQNGAYYFAVPITGVPENSVAIKSRQITAHRRDGTVQTYPFSI